MPRVRTCQGCRKQWPLALQLASCHQCGGTDLVEMELRAEDARSSLDVALAAYRARLGDVAATAQRSRSAGSTDVYPLILDELVKVLGAADIDFILYGSAALWLEGKPRPDATPVQTIKDLDMCACVSDGDVPAMKAHLERLIRPTIAGGQVAWDDPTCYFLSNGNTLEMVSADHTIQFSFSLQPREEYLKIARLSAPVRLPNMSTMLRCAGLEFITDGLIGADSMFHKTLFRSDKTEKLLVYASLCVGYRKLAPAAILKDLVVNLAGACWAEMKKQLSNISVNRHTKEGTKYATETAPLLTKLEDIKKFGADNNRFQKTVESELADILAYVKKSKVSRETMSAEVERRVAAELKVRSDQDLKALRNTISRKVAEESPNASLTLALQLTAEDATSIWKNEVGTGMLIFLLEQLLSVRSTIADCAWIEAGHCRTILTGHAALADAMLLEIDDRLNEASARRPEPEPTAPPTSAPGRGTTARGTSDRALDGGLPVAPIIVPAPVIALNQRVRVEYHVDYDLLGPVTALTVDQVTFRIDACVAPRTRTPAVTGDSAALVGTTITFFRRDISALPP